MCLIATHFLPKISFKPIKVYKVVIEEMNGEITTPFQSSKLLKRAKGKFFFPKRVCNRLIINGGMIHAFRLKEEAQKLEKVYLLHNDCSIKDIKTITAYIPSFTRYYIGEDRDICAKRMRYETLDC